MPVCIIDVDRDNETLKRINGDERRPRWNPRLTPHTQYDASPTESEAFTASLEGQQQAYKSALRRR